MSTALLPILLASSVLAPAMPASAPAPVAPAVAPAAALWGPPGLCHPMDIGTAASLPFGKAAFEIDKAFDKRTTVDETLRLLGAGSDPMVHMETLRRAVVYLTRDDARFPEEAEVGRLVSGLEQRRAEAAAAAAAGQHGGAKGQTGAAGAGAGVPVRALSGDERGALAAGPARQLGAKSLRVEPLPALAGGGDDCQPHAALGAAEALATFDLGYALGLLLEAGHAPRPRGQALELVERAVQARPGNGGMRLGASIVAFSRGEQERSYQHLKVALTCDDPSGLLARNACQTMGQCLGKTSKSELLGAVDAALAQR